MWKFSLYINCRGLCCQVPAWLSLRLSRSILLVSYPKRKTFSPNSILGSLFFATLVVEERETGIEAAFSLGPSDSKTMNRVKISRPRN